MVSIIYSHAGDKFKELKIAGGFNKWEVVPMKWNATKDQWEYELKNIPQDIKKIHFKFIDDSGNWFTDNNYAKEIDEHNNENNVKMLPVAGETREESNNKLDEGVPVTPVPSLNNKGANAEIEEDREVPEKTEMSNDKKVVEPEPITTHDESKPAKNAVDPEDVKEMDTTMHNSVQEENQFPISEIQNNDQSEADVAIVQNKSMDEDEVEEDYSADSTRVNDSGEELEETLEVSNSNNNNEVLKTEDHLQEYKNILQKILEFFASWFAWLRGNSD